MGHILDWREMAAKPTVTSSAFHGLLDFSAKDSWKKLRGAWAGGHQIGEVPLENEGDSGETTPETHHTINPEEWDLGVDDFRGWLIAFAWIVACAIE